MNISDISKVTGLPTKTIRYYEEIRLINPARSSNGYRVFQDQDLHKLAFLGRARTLGFTIEDCRKLLALYEDDTRASGDVRDLAKAHLEEIDQKIMQLKSMQATLRDLVRSCAGDNRPDCPILNDLASG